MLDPVKESRKTVGPSLRVGNDEEEEEEITKHLKSTVLFFVYSSDGCFLYQLRRLIKVFITFLLNRIFNLELTTPHQSVNNFQVN